MKVDFENMTVDAIADYVSDKLIAIIKESFTTTKKAYLTNKNNQ